jgi:hypothetical protein
MCGPVVPEAISRRARGLEARKLAYSLRCHITGGEFFAARINAACQGPLRLSKEARAFQLTHGPKFGVEFTEDMVTISDEQNARATHL